MDGKTGMKKKKKDEQKKPSPEWKSSFQVDSPHGAVRGLIQHSFDLVLLRHVLRGQVGHLRLCAHVRGEGGDAEGEKKMCTGLSRRRVKRVYLGEKRQGSRRTTVIHLLGLSKSSVSLIALASSHDVMKA